MPANKKQSKTSEPQLLKKQVTQLKRELHLVRQEQDYYRLFYENAPLGFQSLDNKGNIIEVNPTWLSWLGYEEQDVIGLPFADLLGPEDQAIFWERFPQFKITGRACDVEYDIRCKNGSSKSFALFGVVRFDEQGEFVQTYCILGDITERRRMERERELERQELKEVNIALRKVLSHIEDEKDAIREGIMLSIERQIKPALNKLKRNREYVETDIEYLENCLSDITSDFYPKMKSFQAGLTTTEMKIVYLIRSGYALKEISSMNHIALSTVKSHVKSVRKKLGLSSKKISLQTFLNSSELGS